MDLDHHDSIDLQEVLETKRFRHQSYHQSLKDVHLPSAFKQTQFEREIGDNDSHFHDTLDHWRQLNLAPSFIQFASKADSLSASMPLLLHHWQEIYSLWLDAFLAADDEGLCALLDLLQKFAHDLRTTLSPIYSDLLQHLLNLLPRSISAPALTTLLETLSSIFRHLLIPSVHLTLLEKTWASIALVLPKCLAEVQRAVAEVWGSVLRRMKSAARERAVRLLVENVYLIEDATAWVVVFACKSVSQTLHTCTSSIFTPLLDQHLAADNPNPDVSHNLLRRATTALIHHANTADQFAPLANVVVEKYLQLSTKVCTAEGRDEDVNVEQLRRVTEVLAIICSARQGSRLTADQLKTLYANLESIPLEHVALHLSLLKYITGLFVAGEMSLWVGPGAKFLQRVWDFSSSSSSSTPTSSPPSSISSFTFATKLTGCLADASWAGWKLLALPLLSKSTMNPTLLDQYPKEVLHFLARLKRGKRISVGGGEMQMDVVWRGRVEKCAFGRLGVWKERGTVESAAELDDILSLSGLFSSGLSTRIIDVINTAFSASSSASSPSTTPTPTEPRRSIHSAWVIGSCMQALAKRDPSEWTDKVDLSGWVRKGVKEWAWSHDVLAGLVVLVQAGSTHTQPRAVRSTEIYPYLHHALLSHSRHLRLAALRLLDSAIIDTSDGGVPVEVLKRCLQGEEVPLDVQGVRERVLRIGRVGQVVGDERGADLCARWLIAQLKVNLRPLWSPSAAALSSLSQRFGDLVWKLFFSELKKESSASGVVNPGSGAGRLSEVGQDSTATPGTSTATAAGGDLMTANDDDPWEDERSWRDPSAHKIRVLVAEWDDAQVTQKRILKEQDLHERFDQQGYQYQLLNALGECSSLAEKHNRELVPYFLSLYAPESATTTTATTPSTSPPTTTATPSSTSTKLPKQKLVAWLTLFSKLSNPKALYATETLHNIYFSLLSHPDRTIQSLALSCVLTYKVPALVQQEDRLRALLDDTRWRDELTLLDINGLDPMARSDVLNVVVRLLFGMMLERKGRSRGADRRAAVLSVLAACTNDELSLLVDLMLRPLGSSAMAVEVYGDKPFEIGLVDTRVSDKQLTGFLTLLGDVLKNLGSRLTSYWPSLLGMTLNILHTAQSRIEGVEDDDGSSKDGDEDGGVEAAEDLDDPEPTPVVSARISRSIRQIGLKRLADFFRIPVTFDFDPYLGAAFESFISPRLALLDRENTQAPSALLGLFHVWTLQTSYVHYIIAYDPETLPKVYDCLIATNVKPSVVLKIFDMVENLLRFSAEDEDIRDSVLKPHVSRLLTNLSILVERTKGIANISTQLYQRQITILSEIAQYSTDADQASMLFGLFSPLLRKPSKYVPEKVKLNLVKIMGELMHLLPGLADRSTTTYQRTYSLISQLFQSLRSRAARIALVATFHKFASIDVSLQPIADLLDSLNAWSTKRLDEPDFERRMDAFSALNQRLYQTISVSDWLPVLYNMLNFIQDHAELSIRTNASFAMRHFVDLVAAQTGTEYDTTFLRILYPGLKNGLRSKMELVRAEILGVVAYAVEKCEHLTSLQEMRVLLENGDPEANFFNNILHVQVHRRSRALRRLGDHCEQGHLKGSTLTEIFIPLVANYITATSTLDHHLVNDAIIAMGHMAKQLGWPAYNALVQKYIKLSKAKDESERVYIRALVSILDNFHFSMEAPAEVDTDKEAEEGEGDAEDDDEFTPAEEPVQPQTQQSAELTARIADAVNLRLLPNLLAHLEKHDPNTDDNTRIPIAIGIVTVAKHLPAAPREAQIIRLLTVLSQILRSKSQETRDLVRDAINRIADSLGPAYLPILLRELRAALTRGPQLHVLAHVVHGLLVHLEAGENAAKFSVLDEIVNDVAHVASEVVFGESGKDVQHEDFKTKMREVRGSSSRGLDSFSIIARHVTPSKISSLLVPVRAIMHETSALKVMTIVDEVLKRITIGLNANDHLSSTELITLCNTLINQNAKFLQQTPTRKKKGGKNDVIVQVKRTVTIEQNHYANNSYRFVTLGLDLLNTALKRTRFDLQDKEIVARLEAIVVTVGETLYSTNAAVLILALRCAAGLSKCPLMAMEKSLPVFVRQALDIIRQAGNTESELVQVAIKSLATILREGPPVQVKEKDFVFLLEVIAPDLEDPTRQGSVFSLLRAIVARKFVVPEIYDFMEKVSEVSVTSQSPQVQELCRGVLLQFLLDYPQGKGRLRNQMTFFAKNLSYVHESGRLSIMELLGAVISKFQLNLILEYADMLFVALVMAIANDDSSKCREKAALLIKSLYIRLDQDRQKMVMSHLHTWASQSSRAQLAWISAQVAGFVIDAAQADVAPYVNPILEDLMAALRMSNASMTFADDATDANLMDIELEWQLSYHSLTVLGKILRVFPDFSLEEGKIAWNLVVSHLLFPHSWVRTAACRLLGTLFNTTPVAPLREDLPSDHPLSRDGMKLAARNLTEQLKSEHLDEALGLQIVKNLFYIGKCFCLIPVSEANSVTSDNGEILDEDSKEAKDEVETLQASVNPLPWLFSKLSYQVRSAQISRRSRSASKPNWSQQPLAVLRWFAAMVSHMEAERVQQFLVHILVPVYRLTEDDTIHDSQMDELKTTATELQDLVQTKVGPTSFTTAYSQIRQSAVGVRRERKVARALQAANNPEAAAKRRMQRNVSKKESKKRKERSSPESKIKLKKRKT